MSLESRIDGLEARIHADNGPGSTKPAFTRPTLLSGNRDRQGLALALPRQPMMPRNETENKLRDIMSASGIIKINGNDYRTEMKDLEEQEELGDGTSGHVVKMLHIPSGAEIAVKQMRRTGNAEENKRIVNDIETALKAHGCPYIVQCLGFIITSVDVWICMELMATCFDKLLKRTSRPVPEDILGKVTVAVVKALSFLKDKDTMHRDVKPSNILVDERGVIKLCDFGISGQLNNSKAKTRSAGCVAYLAPERIDPNRSEYDIRADVWSLGITLVELATGKFPYQDCRTDFEVLTCVMQSAPPTLPADQGFSLEFQNFVKRCLIHDVNSRPKYKDLLLLPFLMCYEAKPVNVSGWLKGAMKLAGLPSHQRDTLLQHQDTDNDQEIEMCSPMQLVRSPQASLFADRHPFAKPPAACPDPQPFCNFRVSSFDAVPLVVGTASGSSSVPARSHHPHHHPSYDQPVVPEPIKVYRKSPFLPRKKASPESTISGSSQTPKKESKLSTLGSSLLKNLTTSPFSQRKQPVPQPELPPLLADKQRATNIPSHHHHHTLHHHQQQQPQHHHHHRPVEAAGHSHIPRHIFQNSPILQRRNPSYITYGECNGAANTGRGGSANTSPIVLQRFFHQQNQLRDKIGDERQSAEYPPADAPDHSNPFVGGNFSPQARKKYQTIRSRNNFEHQHEAPVDGGGHGAIGYNTTSEGLYNMNSKATESTTTTTTTTTTSYVSTHQRLNFRTIAAPLEDNVEEKMQRTMHNEEFTQETSVCDTVPANGKASYEKNLGDVKRRFASYLKVNLTEERRLRNEEFNCQKAQNAPQAFAPTNPFLDASDSYLAAASPPQAAEQTADKYKLDRRHRSPDPPPRYNRQSPLLLRKKLEMTNWGGSPLLSRRLITGSPPIQAPRRDCESVPGSPQHFRTRIHYTPEPQRRFYRP